MHQEHTSICRLVSLIYSKHTISSSSPSNSKAHSLHGNSPLLILPPFYRHGRIAPLPIKAYKVTIEHDNRDTYLEVDIPRLQARRLHDMPCQALISGVVDQCEGMLSDDVIERDFALLCASYPRPDCTIRIIPDEELLSLQLATAND